MNGDTATKIEGFGWGLVKWIVGFVIISSILGFFFWMFFYSAYFANLSFIIPLRNWYQNTYWKTESLVFKPVRTYPPFDPVYIISVDKSGVAGAFRYSLWGTVTSVDTGGKVIYILGSDGNRYVFTLTSYGFSVTGPISKEFEQTGIAALTGSKVLAEWQDARSLNAIKKAYNQNRIAPVNQGTAGGGLILKIFNN